MRTVAGHVQLMLAAAAVSLTVVMQSAGAQSAAELAEQIETLRGEYEGRVDALEAQLSTLEAKAQRADRESAAPTRSMRPTLGNAFNPSIGVVLSGMAAQYSSDEFSIPGFQVGHESERPARGSRSATASSRCRATSTTSSSAT